MLSSAVPVERNFTFITIITSHNIVNVSDTNPNETSLSNYGKFIWEVAKKYNQVFMMFGGQHHGAGNSTLINDAGNPVYAILADYQFAYNGGNGFFKYAEFDEDSNKIFLRTYSPYSATIPESEKTFFDVNFMAGVGNDDILELNFKERFAGMDKETREKNKVAAWKLNNNAPYRQGWLSGEIHNHTNASNDASEPYMLLQNTLNAAFREDLDTIPKEGDPSLDHGKVFDFMMSADHLRTSPRNVNGEDDKTATWEVIEEQIAKYNELRAQGKFNGKIYYPGFEWDMMQLDHAATAIITDGVNVPVDAIHEFEWLFSYDTKDTEFHDNEEAKFGPRRNEKSNIDRSFEGVEWLRDNYPNSFVSINHPSRHNGGNGEVRIEHLRRLNDLAPNIVFSFEGMPGNQMGGDRGEMADIYGGADVMLAEVGGVWDALLGEGRKFYNIGNSDFHFKVSSNRKYSSGYWPSEYTRNYVFTEGNTFLDIVNGIRSGNAFTVYGDLISGLDFVAKNTNSDSIPMGGELKSLKGEDVILKIRFKESDFNNYKAITQHDTNVTNQPKLDHIDLIAGLVTGKASDYTNAKNPSTKIIARFDRSVWGSPDSEGYYTINHKLKVDSDMYFRLRGTNLGLDVPGETDKNGNPLMDEYLQKENFSTLEDYFNSVNDRNYNDLWFYSNPIFVKTVDNLPIDPVDPKPEDPIDSKPEDRKPEKPISPELPIRPGKPEKPSEPRQDIGFDPWIIIGGGKDDKAPKRDSEKIEKSENDYSNHWAKDVIKYVLDKGYMKEDKEEIFNPDRSTTRYEVVKALALVEKVKPNDFKGESLKDIKADSEESGYVNWAIKNNIIHGYEDGTFKGDQPITREEMAKVLNQYVENLKKDRPVLKEIEFKDTDQIGDWAKEDVKKATERGLMKGTDEGKFEPKEKLSKAEVAQIVYNIEK